MEYIEAARSRRDPLRRVFQVGLVAAAFLVSGLDYLELIPAFSQFVASATFEILHSLHDLVAISMGILVAYKSRPAFGAWLIILFVLIHIPYHILEYPLDIPESALLLASSLLGLLSIALMASWKQADELFHKIGIVSPVGCYIVQNGKFRYINRRFLEMVGYAEGDLLNTSPLELVHPDDVSRVKLTATARLKSKDALPYEFRTITNTGTIKWVLESVTSIQYRGKRANLGNFMDITERKQFEQELLDSNRRLEAAQAELLASQRQVIQQERLKAVGVMASGIAHDFNNSLVSIMGFSELLLTTPRILEDKEKALRYIRTINDSGENAAEVVRRLRQFYRPSDEAENFSPLRINSVIADVIRLTRPKWEGQAQEKGIQIQVKTEFGEVPPVMGAESDLREALTNLLFNAVDAMPRGGVVTFTSRRANPGVTIAVSDTGSGMKPEVLQRCMEPFFTTKGAKGTGLGLPLVHGIVQRHGGKITIDSKLGQGTTVTVHLPAGVSDAAGTVSARSVLPSRSLRVLVVDDEHTVREVVSELLRLDGHTPQTVSDGEDALDRMGAPPFDLVITDRAMPKMHGDQLAAIVKARYPGIPVIMLTGFGDKIQALKEQIPGVDVVLSKPVTLERLREAIRQVDRKKIGSGVN